LFQPDANNIFICSEDGVHIQALLNKAAENKTRLIIIAVIVLGVIWLLSDALPDVIGNRLPSTVEEGITRRYTTCISPDDTPIQFNEARQPECGRVDIRVVGEGKVPPEEEALGVTGAICYKVAVQNPYWTTLATTRHEVMWKSRTSSKVAVLQNDAWQVFPDQDNFDMQRWAAYACPEHYESTSGESP
jgi:hypothetical protein